MIYWLIYIKKMIPGLQVWLDPVVQCHHESYSVSELCCPFSQSRCLVRYFCVNIRESSAPDLHSTILITLSPRERLFFNSFQPKWWCCISLNQAGPCVYTWTSYCSLENESCWLARPKSHDFHGSWGQSHASHSGKVWRWLSPSKW